MTEEIKPCSICKEMKPVTLEHFYIDRSKRKPFSSQCRVCQRKRSKDNWQNNRARAKIQAQKWRAKNKDKILANARKLRQDVLDAYGNECKCCGEKHQEFLGIDHVNNDGEGHRKELKGYGRAIYQWLKKNGYPQKGFQLLCHNCNMAKGLYGGCPHKGTPPGRRLKTTRWSGVQDELFGDGAA